MRQWLYMCGCIYVRGSDLCRECVCSSVYAAVTVFDSGSGCGRLCVRQFVFVDVSMRARQWQTGCVCDSVYAAVTLCVCGSGIRCAAVYAAMVLVESVHVRQCVSGSGCVC